MHLSKSVSAKKMLKDCRKCQTGSDLDPPTLLPPVSDRSKGSMWNDLVNALQATSKVWEEPVNNASCSSW